jgi:HD-like signal output (HDOD) protein
MSFQIQSLIKDPNAIPSLPELFYKIMDAINDPDVSMEEVGGLIEKDVSMASRLLGLVNSSLYGLSSKVSKIPQAIGVIGTTHLKELVLCTMVISRFKNIPERYVTMESFWSHSIGCGLAAKELSKLLSIGDEEELYLAGMIHDIGSLVIYKEVSAKAAIVLERCNEWGLGIIDAEQNILGFDHTQVGESLIHNWKLPERLCELVAFHHNPLMAPNFAKEAAILYVAESISESNCLGSSGAMQSQPIDPKVIEFLEISSEDISSISKKSIQSIEEISKIFIN